MTMFVPFTQEFHIIMYNFPKHNARSWPVLFNNGVSTAETI